MGQGCNQTLWAGTLQIFWLPPLTLGAAQSDAIFSGTGDRAPGHSYTLPRQFSCL